MSLPYRRDVDGLRAVAVLFVVGFHYFPSVFRGGFVGVDVFFVISGFLITGLIRQDVAAGKFSIAEFYGRRIPTSHDDGHLTAAASKFFVAKNAAAIRPDYRKQAPPH